MEEETPINKVTAYSNAVITTLHLIFYYGVALGIWGLVVKKIWIGLLVGSTLGLLLGLFSAPAIAKQRTGERAREMIFSVSSIWGNIAIIIGLLGLVVLVVRLIFFR